MSADVEVELKKKLSLTLVIDISGSMSPHINTIKQ